MVPGSGLGFALGTIFCGNALGAGVQVANRSGSLILQD
jgi:hypothetical protein